MTKRHLNRSIIILLAIAVYSPACSSQVTMKIQPTFKTASIKPSLSGYMPGPPAQTDDYFAWTGKTLKELLSYAYRMRPWQIKGGPDWIDSQRWDLEAKAEEKIITTAPKPNDPMAVNEIALMLQSLLEDRFKLRIQRLKEESNVFNLVIANGGIKIKLDDDQSPPTRAKSVQGKGTEVIPQQGESPWNHNEVPRGSLIIVGGIQMGRVLIKARAIPIANFINILLPFSDRPVIDRTNLSGLYNITLKWSEISDLAGPANSSSHIGGGTQKFGPAFLAAIQEQLGLRLELAKAPVDFLVIMSAQKPQEN